MESNSLEINRKFLLKGHKGAIYSLTNAGKGKFFSGGADRQIIEWDLESGEGKLIAHSSATIMSLLYLEERGLLLVGQTEGGVHLIDLKERKEIKLLKGHQSYIFDILWLEEKNEVIFSSADGSISVWSADTFERLYHSQLCQGKVRKMDLDPMKKSIAISRGDGAISILSSLDYSEQKKIDHTSPINVVRFSPDGKDLLAGDKMAHLHQIELSSGRFAHSLPAHYWAIYDIVYSPNREFFATASRDKTIKIWDPIKLQVLKRLEGPKVGGHTHSVNSLLWPEQNVLISAGDDSDIRIWEVKS